MKKEVQYIDGLKIVGHSQRDGNIIFEGKDGKIMQLLNERLKMKDFTFMVLRSFPAFEKAYRELKQIIRDAGNWHVDGLDFVLLPDLAIEDKDIEDLEPGWSSEFDFHVRVNDTFVLVAVPDPEEDGFMCTLVWDYQDPDEIED